MKHIIVLILLAILPLHEARAQYNTNRLIISGQSALYYEDYVLSIQYFNQALAAKPYLYEPWFYRGLAKFYLDDYTGSEADVTRAIELNPYIYNMFELRGLCRIRQKHYAQAIDDYTRSINLNPQNQTAWYNRALCRVEDKDYAQAQLDLDTVVTRWQSYASAYSLKAQVYLLQTDTLTADKWLDKCLKVAPYDVDAWNMRGMIALSRAEWKNADTYLSKVIHLKPKNAANYVNRALARYNINNLRGAMADYDTALNFDPNNFLAHYNRGLLRMNLGDDNRAIEDFDYVIRMEPENVLAIFNRAILLDKTGNLRAAIRDYSTVINQFPNFWTGLARRANCYRRLGMKAKAELDEFRILKAQMDKHIGKQPRWTATKAKQMRRRSEIDMEKYNQIVVSDDNSAEHEYKSEYRGRVQDRAAGNEPLPMFCLSLVRYTNDVRSYQPFAPVVDAFNRHNAPLHVYVNNQQHRLDESLSRRYLAVVDSLTARINAEHNEQRLLPLLVQRAVAESVTQNYDAALNDLNTVLGSDDNSVLALWHKAYCQSMSNEFSTAASMQHGATDNDKQGRDMSFALNRSKVVDCLNQAIMLDRENQFLYYNRGCALLANKNYTQAIDDFTRAINIDNGLAEAYYNRGLARIKNGLQQEGIADLSKAGELGLYNAYSVIKRLASKN